MSRSVRSSSLFLGLLLCGGALLPSCAHSVPWGGAPSKTVGQPSMTSSAAYVCSPMSLSPMPVIKQSTNLQPMPPPPTGQAAECAKLRCVAGTCSMSFRSPLRVGGGVVQFYCDVRAPAGGSMHVTVAPAQYFGRAGVLPEGSIDKDVEITKDWQRIGAVKVIKPEQEVKQDVCDITLPEAAEIGQCGFSL